MLTPLDIEQKEFSKSVSGYKKIEVEDFLNRVAQDMEGLINQKIALEEKLITAQEELDKFNRIEQSIREALVLAEKTKEDTVQQAREKADVIIKEAQLQAKHIVEKANTDIVDLQMELETRKKELAVFKMKFKTMLKTQIEAIDQSEI